jgi:hypothetical protein
VVVPGNDVIPMMMMMIIIIIGLTSVFLSYERAGRFPMLGFHKIGYSPVALPVAKEFHLGEILNKHRDDDEDNDQSIVWRHDCVRVYPLFITESLMI